MSSLLLLPLLSLLVFSTANAKSCFPTPEYRAEGDHVIFGTTYCGEMGNDVVQINVPPAEMEVGEGVFARHGTALYFQGKLVAGVNAIEVRLVSNDYVKDSTSVYSLSGNGKQNVNDVGTFVYIGNGYYKNSVNVYFDKYQPRSEYDTVIRRISLGLVRVELDPQTVSVKNDFAADGKNLYCHEKILSTNGSYHLFEEYSLVGNKVFFCANGRTQEYSAAISAPLKQSDDRYFVDARRAYFDFVAIPDADPMTFHALVQTYGDGSGLCRDDLTSWAADKKNIYRLGERVSVVDQNGREITFNHTKIHLLPDAVNRPAGRPSDALGYMEDGTSRFVIQSDTQRFGEYLVRYTGNAASDSGVQYDSGENLSLCKQYDKSDQIKSSLPENIFANPKKLAGRQVLNLDSLNESNAGIIARLMSFIERILQMFIR